MLYLTLVNLRVNSEDETKKVGEVIGRLLCGGEILQLVGDVGAGKTTFTKGLAKGLKVTETVQSPTFTISRVYDGRDNLRLAHYDFYRLSDPGIMADELSEASDDPSTVICIEWGEIVNDVIGDDFLEIQLMSPTETERELGFKAHGKNSTDLLRKLRQQV